ncbi:caspase family protein [Sorangium sp. So ce406]|uniref:caspase family protein n=1 Tax=Sorangium sp. So ce406 TaxID=3133311 RepID=UPI003F5BD5BB
MFHNEGYALFIGVNDYRVFDRSMGNAAGTSDLEGSVNDVATFWHACVRMGMRPENLRVVTSPRADLARLPGATEANLGEATEKGVREALGWLADKVAGGRAGLMTYSGHGAHTPEKGLLLCPSDVSGPGFERAIAFEELGALLKDAENLTVVLDCCHGNGAAPDARGRRPLTLVGAAPPGRLGDDDLRIGARVLAACRPGEVTQQATFGGRPQGAFTWAIGAVIEQWTAAEDGGCVYLTLSYGELVRRTRLVLDALDLEGTPQIVGEPGVARLAVLQTGSRPEKTSHTPDAGREVGQLDGGMNNHRIYTLKAIRSQDPTHPVVLAQVLVTGNYPPAGYKAQTEYYWVSNSVPSDAQSIQLTAVDGGSLPSGSYNLSWGQITPWIGNRKPQQGATNFIYAGTSGAPTFGLNWGLSYDPQSSKWTGSIRWYDTTGSNLFGGVSASSINYTATNNTAPPAGLTYKAEKTWT